MASNSSRAFEPGDRVRCVEARTPWQQDMKAAAPDNIHQPQHYARFVIEPITFINANRLPFNIGNVIKYSCRYDAKNGVEDLLKARRYLDIQIECMSREARVAGGEMARDAWKVAL